MKLLRLLSLLSLYSSFVVLFLPFLRSTSHSALYLSAIEKLGDVQIILASLFNIQVISWFFVRIPLPKLIGNHFGFGMRSSS